MDRSISALIRQQRSRIDDLARLAGRFNDEPVEMMLLRLSGRLARIGATLSLPAARQQGVASRVEGRFERLLRDVSLARFDDRESVTRIAWSVAEIEETIRQSPVEVVRPIYFEN